VALKHPPCPNPPTSRVDNDVSLDFDSSYETQYEEVNNEISVLQSVHGDDFNPYGGLADEEAVRNRQFGAEDSDTMSLIQALPSSASIWFNSRVDATHISGTSASDSNNLIPCISADTFNIVRSSGTMDRFFTTEWASTSRQPRLCDTLRQPGDLPGDRYRPHPADVALPEKITLSLLEAMETRDRQETTVRIDKKRRKRSIFGSRKIIKGAVQWTWKKLHFW
jgi:hypothetical protein